MRRSGAYRGLARIQEWRVRRSGAYAGVARIQEWCVYRSGAYTGVARTRDWREIYTAAGRSFHHLEYGHTLPTQDWSFDGSTSDTVEIVTA